MNNDDVNGINTGCLKKEMYHQIMNGLDIREFCIPYFEGDDEGRRVAAGMFMVLFESYPLHVTVDVLTSRVNEKMFGVMEDGAFRDYVAEYILMRTN